MNDRIVVIDREDHGWFAVATDDAVRSFEHEDLLSGWIFENHPDCGTLVVEYAHLHPKVGRSLAQIYDEDELAELERVADRYGVKVRVFPQTLTYRAINEESGVDDKSSPDYQRNAAWSIYRHLHRYPRTLAACKLWRAPTPTDKRLNEARQAIRGDVNRRLNEMRTYPKYLDHDEVKMAFALLERAVPRLDAVRRSLLADYFGIELAKSGKRVKTSGVKWPSVMAVYCTAFNDDGTLRTDDRGRFIGVNGVARVLKLSAFHVNAGVARSNLMYFGQASREKALGLGNKDAPDAGDNTDAANARRVALRERRAASRREFQRAVRALVRLLRDSANTAPGSATGTARGSTATESTRAPVA